jgi:hypothetical protein
MTTDMSDIDRTVRALVSLVPAEPQSDPLKPRSPALDVFCCLLSLDRRSPEYVAERIERLREPDLKFGSLAGVKALVESFSSPKDLFVDDLRDDGKRADLLVPLLDALIDVQRDHPGATEAERLEAWASAASPADWAFGAFKLIGLKGFQDLRLLLGANALVPTRAHSAFVSRAVGRTVELAEAAYLLERAGRRLGYPVGWIDEAIWKGFAKRTRDISGSFGAM